jgi:uncharacterized protein (DUF362 family)/NAD-dependent dihydropyrimidine dehydrogenase PreA subunit
MSKKTSIVTISKCPSYEYGRVEAAVHAALEPLGGIREFVSPGDVVLLKINLLAAKAPERGITTHPAVLEAVAREVMRAGGKVVVGDSPAGVLKGIKRFWKNTGVGPAVERLGGELVKFEGSGTKEYRSNGRTYHLTSFLDRVDVVINLPKLKTHGLTLFTGAVKNCFGLVPGFQKSEFHKAAPKVEPFSNLLVDVFGFARPRLNIMDGVLGLEGNGPSTSGSAREVGLLLASPDAVAMDAVAARIIGLEEGVVATTRIAASRGLGEGELRAIAVEGADLDEIAIGDYKLPSNYYLNFIPTALVKLLGRFVWVRPKAESSKCTGCGICIKNCPVDAMTPNRHRIPEIDYSLCISCLSCDESCPEDAIEQKVSWLARKLT